MSETEARKLLLEHGVQFLRFRAGYQPQIMSLADEGGKFKKNPKYHNAPLDGFEISDDYGRMVMSPDKRNWLILHYGFAWSRFRSSLDYVFKFVKLGK